MLPKRPAQVAGESLFGGALRPPHTRPREEFAERGGVMLVPLVCRGQVNGDPAAFQQRAFGQV